MLKKLILISFLCLFSSVAWSAGTCIGTPIKDNFIGNFLKNFWDQCRGSYTDSNGNEYIGKYNNGNLISSVTVIEAAGAIYKGGLKDKKYNGKGEILYLNGDKYKGFWKNNKYHGKGIIIFNDGIRLKSEFEKGLPQISHAMSTQNRYIGNLMSYCILSERSSQSTLSKCINNRDRLIKETARLEYEATLERNKKLIQSNKTKEKKKLDFGKITENILTGALVLFLADKGIEAYKNASPQARSEFLEVLSNAYRDKDWDWDQFYDQYNRLIWMCRDIQTGRFAENDKCKSDEKTDHRWPHKRAKVSSF